eukprot:g5390.t1
MLVELKNGDTYNGRLDNCDSWMNIKLKDVIFTSRDADKFVKMVEVYVRGNSIKYVTIPEEVLDMVQEEDLSKEKRAMGGRGRGGRGRGGRDGGRGGGRGRGDGRGGRGRGDGRGRGGGRGGRGERGRGRGGPGGGANGVLVAVEIVLALAEGGVNGPCVRCGLLPLQVVAEA